MGELFDVVELVRVAVEDERTGGAFYAAAAKQVSNPELKGIFTSLAEQERYHQKRFENMLAELGEMKPPELYSGEYANYLGALTRDRAFPDETSALKMADQCEDDLAFLDVALGFERNTLNLVNEMRVLVAEADKDIVDDITCEEQAHLVALLEARDRLKG
ncbi:MAG: ferritin-like domain-containing protein [Planctomycetota bacterium]|jgi:Mn-containing catalase